MDRKFTLNDLFLYHYNELNPSEVLEIESLISSNDEFYEENIKILEMKSLLNSAVKTPSESSIRFILDYDRKSSGELAY